MMFYTHLAFGFLAGLLTMKLLTVNNIYPFFAVVLLSSILPDIDIGNSKVGRGTKLGWLVEWVFGHRGFFHSAFPAVILFIFFYSFGYGELGLASFVGYGSHLISDALGHKGVYLFYPLAKLRLGLIKTGGFSEYLFLGLIIYLSVQILI
ncbi:TPA: metal-dependent hydrolase [archaeon]|nr:metal-dependent hydrolase [Candidatus Naiadarchaeales archaeon SRR2090153.bin1042]